MLSAPAYRTRSRTRMAQPPYVLGAEMQHVRTPQDLEALRQRVNQEFEEAYINFNASAASTPRRGDDQSHTNGMPLPSRHVHFNHPPPSIAYSQDRACPSGRLPMPFSQTPSMQWDNGAHNFNGFQQSTNEGDSFERHDRARQGSSGLPNLDSLTLRGVGRTNYRGNRRVNQGPHRHRSSYGESNNLNHVNRSFLESTREHHNIPHEQNRLSDGLLTESDHERMDRCFNFYASRDQNNSFQPERSQQQQSNNNNNFLIDLSDSAAGAPNPASGTFDPATGAPNPPSGPYNPAAGPYNPAADPYNPAFDPYNNPAACPYNPSYGHYNPAAGPYNPAPGPYNPAPGHLNPALDPNNPAPGPYNPAPGPYNPAPCPYNPAPGPYNPGPGNFNSSGTFNQAPNAPNPPPVSWQFRGPELQPPVFSGNETDYQEWKLAFRSQVDSYPEKLRVVTLKNHLDNASKDFIAYINPTDPEAYAECFRALDQRCGGTAPPQHLYTGKLLELLSGPQADSLQDLEKIYNILNYTHSKLSQSGHESYAEPMLLGLTNILFGKSQYDVDQLSTTNRLNVPNVLDAIWEHMRRLRTREQNKRLTGHAHNPTQPKHGSMFHTAVNMQVPPVSSGMVHPKQSQSPTRGQNSSRPQGPPSQTQNSPYRGNSPGRGNYNQQRPNSPARSHSQSPRRRQPFFMCQLCETNDHSHITCSKFSIKTQFRMCTDKRLCFVCKSAGHGARVCPHQNLRCTLTACSDSPPHNTSFCEFAKPQ